MIAASRPGILEIPIILGIVLGSNFSAMVVGELKLYWRVPFRQYLSAHTVPATVKNMGYAVSVTKEQGHYLTVICRDGHG